MLPLRLTLPHCSLELDAATRLATAACPQRPTRRRSLLPGTPAADAALGLPHRHVRSEAESSGEDGEWGGATGDADDLTVRLGFGHREWSPIWARAHAHPRLGKIAGLFCKDGITILSFSCGLKLG